MLPLGPLLDSLIGSRWPFDTQDLVFFPGQFVVVDKKLFKFMKELIPKIADVVDVGETMVVLLFRNFGLFLRIARNKGD